MEVSPFAAVIQKLDFGGLFGDDEFARDHFLTVDDAADVEAALDGGSVQAELCGS